MKLPLVLVITTELLLPAYGWGQRVARPLPVKPETKQAHYARLDRYAQHLPEAQAATLEKLAASLATQARSDDDKARLIFAWLTYHIAYDATLSNSDTTHYYRRCTPDYVLQNRKAVCKGYADLFTSLATRMKLPARTITGHGRTNSDTGNLLSFANGHGWNAYRIAGTWHLADATWGAGGFSTNTNEFQQQFEPFWFDTPPAQFIFSHLPDTVAWQLLPTPVTMVTYQNWPYVSPEWFSLISGESMRKTLASNSVSVGSLPIIKSNSHGVKLIQAPKSGELLAKHPVTFVFSIPVGTEMFIVTDTSSVPLRAVGNYWQATITPIAGNVWVLAQRKDDFETSVNILKYAVIPTPSADRRSGKEHNNVPNSVEYLRP